MARNGAVGRSGPSFSEHDKNRLLEGPTAHAHAHSHAQALGVANAQIAFSGNVVEIDRLKDIKRLSDGAEPGPAL